MNVKQKDRSIDLLKFVATLAIFNHLARPYYGKYTMLATGGAIGCVLFFFCAGFLATLGGEGQFLPWMKRKLCRLWPTCLMTVLFYEAICGLHFEKSGGGVAFALKGAGWFVPCLLVHFVAWWCFCKKAKLDALIVLAINFAISSVIVYVWVPMESPGLVLFGGISDFFKWPFCFTFFLLGAVLAGKKSHLRYRLWMDAFMLFVCVVVFYSMYLIAQRSMLLTRLQFVEWIPLIGFAYYAFKVAKSIEEKSVLASKWVNCIICFVGGLSLEMYLVGGSVAIRNLWKDYPYPIGYLCGFMTALVVAYAVRSAGRIFAQTLDRSIGSYDWHAAFRLY